MVSKWIILKSTIIAEPTNVVKMIKAICILHNFLRETDPAGFVDTVDPNGTVQIESPIQSHSRNHTQAAFKIRDKFASFFSSSAGELPWQTDYVLRTR